MEIIKDYNAQIHELQRICGKDIHIVWNNMLDQISDISSVKLILVGDNPGPYEFKENIYLSPNGKCGAMAKNFFSKLNLTLHKDVIVLNKTPFHTSKTADLKKIVNDDTFVQSQTIMAKFAVELLKMCSKNNQNTKLWILGSSQSNFGKNPLFGQYKKVIQEMKQNKLWEKIFCYYHFSCGSFHKELYKHMDKKDICDIQILQEVLDITGTNRKNLFF